MYHLEKGVSESSFVLLQTEEEKLFLFNMRQLLHATLCARLLSLRHSARSKPLKRFQGPGVRTDHRAKAAV
jgi:hypothetical protein